MEFLVVLQGLKKKNAPYTTLMPLGVGHYMWYGAWNLLWCDPSPDRCDSTMVGTHSRSLDNNARSRRTVPSRRQQSCHSCVAGGQWRGVVRNASLGWWRNRRKAWRGIEWGAGHGGSAFGVGGLPPVCRCVLLMVDGGLNASRFLRGFSVRRQRHYRM